MHDEIVQIGHPVLREKAQPLTKEEILSKETRELTERMKEIMRAAPGVGLAAPQIGISKQIIVIEDREEYMQKFLNSEELATRERKPIPFHVLFNPKIVSASTEQVIFFEGCLSGFDLIGNTPRSRQVVVEALDEEAKPCKIEASGWYARILQHEIDHLNGVLCIDRADTKTLSTRENYFKFWHRPSSGTMA